MKIEKILKYLEDVELAKECYHQQSPFKYSVSSIARLLRKSEGTVSKMIMSEYPKSVQKYLKENQK